MKPPFLILLPSLAALLTCIACGGGDSAKGPAGTPPASSVTQASTSQAPSGTGTPKPVVNTAGCAPLIPDPNRPGSVLLEAASYTPPDSAQWTLQGCTDDGGGVTVIYARKPGPGMDSRQTVRASIRYIRTGPLFRDNPQLATADHGQVLQLLEQAMEQGDTGNPRYKDQQFGTGPEPGRPDCLRTSVSLHDVGVPGAQGQAYLQVAKGRMCVDSNVPPRALIRMEWSERTPPGVTPLGDAVLGRELGAVADSLKWTGPAGTS